MIDATDIEKKSLEAHVELCAERYKLLESKLSNVESSVQETKAMVEDLAKTVSYMAEKSNDRLIQWGVGIIASLAALCGWLFTHYLSK
jgi:hypothetical protein